MVIASGQFLKRLGGILLALSLTHCGDETDPDAISPLELKSPGGLVLVDNGEGKVTLKWYTSNLEEDFEGYNVYGAALTDASLTTLGMSVGSPVQLLDEDGEPKEAVKLNIMPTFDYTTDNENALPGAAAPIAEAEEESELSKLPIHSRNESDTTDPLLPTCRPNSEGTCEFNTSATVPDPATIYANGVVSFDLSSAGIQLTEGTQYCFFVLAVQSEGEEVSESSSDLACITPRFKASVSLSFASNQTIDLTTLRGACSTSTHSCGTITPTSTNTGSQLRYQTTTNVKAFNGIGKPIFIKRLDTFKNGFTDFVEKAPTFVYDSNDVAHTGGYAPNGQLIKIEPYSMWAVAEQDATTATSIYYHYFWVNSSAPQSATGTVDIEFRIANFADKP